MSEQEAVLKKQMDEAVDSLRAYLEDECGVSLGRFEVIGAVQHVSKHLSAYHYNRGLFDAAALVSKHADTLTEAITALEKY